MKKVNLIKTVLCFLLGTCILTNCQKEKTTPATDEIGAVKYAESILPGADTRLLGTRPDWMGLGGTLSFLKEGINLPSAMPDLFVSDGDNIPSGILVTKKTFVYVTYVGNVAAFNNVLGYYYYKKTDGIDGEGILNRIYHSGMDGIHFKNIIYDHTKDLEFGVTLKLSDDDGNMFEPGTVIGFCVMPNAGGGATTDSEYKTVLPNVKMKDGKPIFIATNKEVNENEAISHIIGQSACGDLIIAFEDLNSIYSKSTDLDFNDLVFLVGDNLTSRTTDNIVAYSTKDDTQLFTFGENCQRDHCGDKTTVELIINQQTIAGSVTVWNDAVNLYVEYKTDNGWFLDKTCLFVGKCDIKKTEFDQSPYRSTCNPCVETYTYVIPLDQLSDCFCVVAHAEVVKFNDGKKSPCEMAWGNGDRIEWGMKFGYCKQSCGEEPYEPCYGDDETGWCKGLSYGGNNWAMYTPYAIGDIDIMAGQHIVAGKASFSAVVNGKVTITISLNGWALQDVEESVKIQGYNSAPSGNPAPGQFNTYKGKNLTITVNAFTFYGIHLDLREIVDCD